MDKKASPPAFERRVYTQSGKERGAVPTALLDTKEAAAYLALSVSTLRRMMGARAIRFLRMGRVYRFRVEDLDAFIAEQQRKTEEEDATGRGRPRLWPRTKNEESRG